MKVKNCLTLSNEFLEFCRINGIEDTEAYANEVFNAGFAIKKYGEKPQVVKPTKEVSTKTNVKKLEELNNKKITVPKSKNDIYDE